MVKELEESILSCRSREVAAKARVSQLRELASGGNPASPEAGTTLSISRRRDENSRTEPDVPLELAPLDFAYRASEETNTFEPTSGLHGEIDEFRGQKAMYPNASSLELAEFQFFAKAVAGYWENPGDGRGSEHHGGDFRKNSDDDYRRGRNSSHKDSRDFREHPPGD